MDGGKLGGYVDIRRFVDIGINGGTFTGTLNIDAAATNDNSYIVFAGTPVVSGKLSIPEGYKIVLGELTSGAKINVAATGVFTAANEKASQYAAYFHPESGYEVVAENNQLAVKAVTNP